MASASTEALSIAAILLGLFILYSSWTALPTLTALQIHHIGCYHSEQRHDHSDSISFSLEELYRREQFQRLQLQKMGTWKVDSNKFSEQALSIARKFEVYAEKHSQYIYSQQSDTSIQTVLKESALRYENCRRNYQHFKSQLCVDDWSEYMKCSSKLELIKNDLTKQKQNRAKIEGKIDQYLSPRPPATPKHTPKPSDGNFEAFQARLKMIDIKIQSLQSTRSELTNKVEKQNYLLSEIDITLLQTEKLLTGCQQNQLQFSNCQTITKEINDLGQKAIKSVKQRIDQKLALLKNLKKIIEESRGGVESIRASYHMHVQEFKGLLISNFIATSHSSKQCRCTEAMEEKYKGEIQGNKAKKSSILGEIQASKAELKRLEEQFKDLKEEREKVIRAYQESLRNEDPIAPIASEDQLMKYKSELEVINHQILKLKEQYDALQNECAAARWRLNERLKGVDAAQECLKRKHYADKLNEIVISRQATTTHSAGREQLDLHKQQLKDLVQRMEL